MLAYDYPILGLFWTMFIFFLWFAWLMLLFRVFADIFRSPDMGGGLKALWSIFVILVPFLGVLVYVIVRGHSMTEHDIDQAPQHEAHSVRTSRKRRAAVVVPPTSSPSSPTSRPRECSPTRSSPNRRPSCWAENSARQGRSPNLRGRQATHVGLDVDHSRRRDRITDA